MSLDKAIKSGKERRKPYRRSAAFDRTCRPNGGCPHCLKNRQVWAAKLAADSKLRDA